MRTEDFVTYEQALDLKKLGFNENCIFFYSNRNHMKAFCVDSISIQYTPNNIGGYLNQNKNTDEYTCDAPTLAEVQKWLRRTQKISVEPFVYWYSEGKDEFWGL